MTCPLHPNTETAGSCEYCAQAHCGQCLQPLLGRRYCPSCYARVAGIARKGTPLGTLTTGGASSPLGRDASAQNAVRPRLPGWLSALLYVIGFVIVDLVAQLGLGLALGIARAAQNAQLPNPMALNPLDASGIGLPGWSLLFLFFGWLTLLLVLGYTALFVHGIERRKLTDLGLDWSRRLPSDAATGLALATVLFVSVVGVGLSLGWYRVAAIANPVTSLGTALVGFLILLPFAAVEEVSMRGFVLRATTRSWGKWGGLVASSVVFAGLHLQNPEIGSHPLAVLGLLLAGFYLGSAALITGDLWLAIFLHTGWNLMEGPFFGLPVSGMQVPASILSTHTPGADLLTGGTFGPEAGLLLCGLMAVHLAALWCLRPWLERRRASNLPTDIPMPEEREQYAAVRLS